MKNQAVSFLFNKYFIALIATLATFSFLPPHFPEYKLGLLEEEYRRGNDEHIYYVDLDHDGSSEKVRTFEGTDTDSRISFILYESNGDLIDQWTLPSDSLTQISNYWFFDLDNNGYREVYFVTDKNDSAFLNRIEPLSNDGIRREIKRIFVDSTKKYDGQVGARSDDAFESNHQIDGTKELYFSLSAGYAGYPRNVYRFQISGNKITKSPYLINGSKLAQVIDIDADNFDEIMIKSYSYGNDIVSNYSSFSDYSLWLNVLSHNLNSEFEPVEFKIPFSELHPLPFKNNNKIEFLNYLYSSQKETSPSKLMVHSSEGEIIREIRLGSGLHQVFLNSSGDGFLVYNTISGELNTYDFDLCKLRSSFLEPSANLFEIDLNEDGSKEWILVPFSGENFSIYQEDFGRKVSFDLVNDGDSRFYLGVRKMKGGDQIYLQNGSHYYLFDYAKNQYYYINLFILPSLYLVILGLIFIVIKGHEIKVEKQRAIESQIAELQIKTIKNQVDPHFVFNAINTMSEMMLTDNKLEADRFIGKFSKLMRSTLEKSDKIVSTLQEELDYVENFIQLQQTRFNNKFDYSLTVNPAIDKEQKVPKHVLYSYVENAIKHGLPSKDRGLLKIEIKNHEDKLLLVIEDNGGGRGQATMTERNSTGSGLVIMEQIYALFGKLQKRQISSHIEDVEDEEGNEVGVRVSVVIGK